MFTRSPGCICPCYQDASHQPYRSLDGAYLNRFVVEQTPYYLLDRQVERELIPMAQSYGMRLTVWLPLAESFLTGKYRPGSARPEAARFRETREQSAWVDRHFVDG